MNDAVKDIIEFVKGIWFIIIAFFAAISFLVKTQYDIVRMRNILFDKEGKINVMTKANCMTMQTQCSNIFCKKLDAIQEYQREMDRKRELARTEEAKKFEKIAGAIGRLEGYILKGLNQIQGVNIIRGGDDKDG